MLNEYKNIIFNHTYIQVFIYITILHNRTHNRQIKLTDETKIESGSVFRSGQIVS